VSIAPVPGLHGKHGDARFVGADDASGQRVLRAVIVVFGCRAGPSSVARRASIEFGSYRNGRRPYGPRTRLCDRPPSASAKAARVGEDTRERRRVFVVALLRRGFGGNPPSTPAQKPRGCARSTRTFTGRLRTMQILISFLRARGHLDRRPGLRQFGGRNRDPDRSSGQVGQHSEGVFPWPTTKPW
jgi:hypothetical protein